MRNSWLPGSACDDDRLPRIYFYLKKGFLRLLGIPNPRYRRLETCLRDTCFSGNHLSITNGI